MGFDTSPIVQYRPPSHPIRGTTSPLRAIFPGSTGGSNSARPTIFHFFQPFLRPFRQRIIIKGYQHLPGVAIGLVVLSGNFLGDWLRDKMDPRLRQL